MFFNLVFLSGFDFFFNLDLYLFLSLLYGTQVYSFAAIPAICRLCLIAPKRFLGQLLIAAHISSQQVINVLLFFTIQDLDCIGALFFCKMF